MEQKQNISLSIYYKGTTTTFGGKYEDTFPTSDGRISYVVVDIPISIVHMLDLNCEYVLVINNKQYAIQDKFVGIPSTDGFVNTILLVNEYGTIRRLGRKY